VRQFFTPSLNTTEEASMNHYRKRLELKVTAQTAFDALTTQSGIEGWWTRTCEVGAGLGAAVTVRFGKTYKVMRIERADPGREVRWRCVESYLSVPGVIDRAGEWQDHIIVFRLHEPSPGQSVLDFEHIGLDPTVQCYDVCSAGWEQFLASFKAYTETGRGHPFK
jgi:uncharacterized protein YndB with AHSA1/START domain